MAVHPTRPPALSAPLAGNAYAARKNNPDKSWQQAAYTDEIAHKTDGAGSAPGQARPAAAVPA